eukprot:12414096-Karenia_brevis.AAC.2
MAALKLITSQPVMATACRVGHAEADHIITCDDSHAAFPTCRKGRTEADQLTSKTNSDVHLTRTLRWLR